MIAKSSLGFTTLCLACLLDLGTNTSFPALANSQYTSVSPAKLSRSEAAGAGLKGWKFFPRRNFSAPSGSVGGAVRGGKCISKEEAVQMLLPKETNIGLTVDANPTLFAYIPQTSAQQAELTLYDGESGPEVYKKTFNISQTPGINRFSIPASENVSPLKVGKQYQWELSIKCSQDPADDIRVTGWVQREDNPTLAEQLKKAKPSDRPAVYAKAGYWLDTLKALADLRQANSDTSTLAADWAGLLKSQGLDAIAEKPLISCCTAAQNSAQSSGQ